MIITCQVYCDFVCLVCIFIQYFLLDSSVRLVKEKKSPLLTCGTTRLNLTHGNQTLSVCREEEMVTPEPCVSSDKMNMRLHENAILQSTVFTGSSQVLYLYSEACSRAASRALLSNWRHISVCLALPVPVGTGCIPYMCKPVWHLNTN